MMKNIVKLTKLLIVGAILLLSNALSGQGWINYYGDTTYQIGYEVLPSPDQGFLLVGIQTDPPNDTQPHIVAVKIDDEGQEQWSLDIVTGLVMSGSLDIVENNEGNVVIMAADGTLSEENTYLTAIDWSGNQLWNTSISRQCNAIDLALDGGYIFSGRTPDNDRDFLLIKTDVLGQVEWEEAYHLSENDVPADVLATSQGKYVLVGTSVFSGTTDTYSYMLQTDLNGAEEWSFAAADSLTQVAYLQVIENSEGNYVRLGQGTVDFNDDIITQEVDTQGNVLWTNRVIGPEDEGGFSIAEAESGYVVGGTRSSPLTTTPQPLIYKLDDAGNLEWDFYTENLGPSQFRDAIVVPWGGYLGMGFGVDLFNVVNTGDYSTNLFAVRLDSLGLLYSHRLLGQVVFDENEDCTTQTGESGLEGWLVQVEGNLNQYDFTDADGRYNFLVDTGEQVVTVYPPGEYWTTCQNTFTLDITTFYDTTYQNFHAQTLVDCPLLDVDLSTGFVRPCQDSLLYAVHYINQGTAPAEDAYVEVTLNEWMEYAGATIPLSTQSGNVFTFDLGTLEVNESGAFGIFYNTHCDSLLMGETVCSYAHIYPDSICIDTLWAGPQIMVDAICLGDSIQFTITNLGDDMPQPQYYVIIEDNIILMTESFQLNNLQSEVFSIPAAPNTSYSLLAEQAAGYPSILGNPFATINIENCNGGTMNSLFSILPLDDGSPFYEEDCRIVRAAYDPNDKTGFPFGLGEEHEIQQNMDLEYLIRFQNIGNDTAFHIVIRDTLSPYLDISTLELGASSHPYTAQVRGGRALTFTFADILLPDSTTNEVASNGWVKFRIAQRANNPIGTRIENRAAIYFDFNPPVITNQTFHTIGEDFIDVVNVINEVAFPDLSLQVFPNPTDYSAQIQLQNAPPGAFRFQLYDTTGRSVRQIDFSGNEFTFYKESLPAGIYFFQIIQDGHWVSSGKLILK